MLRTVKNKNTAFIPIYMLIRIIYEHSIDKQDYKGIFKIVSSVKYHFVV